MVTKLQDIANQVAQEDISTNPRLRNEEIRRRMYGDWEEPVIQPEEAPGGLQDATKQDTLAKTYSALRNNYNLITHGISSSDTSTSKTPQYNQTISGQAPLSGTPGWLPSAVGYGLNVLGQGQYAGLAAGATQLLQGNRAGAVGTLSNIFTNRITEGKIPGLGSMVGTLASGLVGDKSAEDIGRGLLNSGIGTVISMANPLAGMAYSLARNFGFNPAQGLGELFGLYDKVPPNFEGGFFGERSAYNTPTSTYGTGSNNVGGAYSNLTGTEGYGESMGGYSGLGIGNPSSYGGSGFSSSDSDSGSWSSYSSSSAYSGGW